MIINHFHRGNDRIPSLSVVFHVMTTSCLSLFNVLHNNTTDKVTSSILKSISALQTLISLFPGLNVLLRIILSLQFVSGADHGNGG